MAQGIRNPLHFGLPQRLKRARKAVKIAPSALATRAGLSLPVTSRIEGGAVPTIATVEVLARALGIRPGWLAYARPQSIQPEEAAEGHPVRHPGAGVRLREARERAGLTRTALGRAAACSGTAILNIEEGRSVPTVETLEALADALSVSPRWLAYDEGEERSPSK